MDGELAKRLRFTSETHGLATSHGQVSQVIAIFRVIEFLKQSNDAIYLITSADNATNKKEPEKWYTVRYLQK